MEQEHKKRMQELDKLMEQTKKWQLEGKSEEEIKTLAKEEMINTFKSTAFNVCENQPLQMLKDTKMEVIIKPGAIPKRTMRPIPCPIYLREQAKKNLEAGVKLGIIEPVQLNGEQPSWISPALFVLKSNGGCREVVNFKHLNVHCERQPNHTSDVLKLVSQVPTALDSATEELFFTVLDAWNQRTERTRIYTKKPYDYLTYVRCIH